MIKYVICDTDLDTSGVTIGQTNPCQVRWFDKFSKNTNLPHWVGSAWYAQLFTTEAAADAVIALLVAQGDEGHKIRLESLEP
jgi:hypothetical protein